MHLPPGFSSFNPCRKATLGVWRKVPESDAGRLEEGAGKRRWEFGGRCRKAMLGVWRKVPESDAGSAHWMSAHAATMST